MNDDNFEEMMKWGDARLKELLNVLKIEVSKEVSKEVLYVTQQLHTRLEAVEHYLESNLNHREEQIKEVKSIIYNVSKTIANITNEIQQRLNKNIEDRLGDVMKQLKSVFNEASRTLPQVIADTKKELVINIENKMKEDELRFLEIAREVKKHCVEKLNELLEIMQIHLEKKLIEETRSYLEKIVAEKFRSVEKALVQEGFSLPNLVVLKVILFATKYCGLLTAIAVLAIFIYCGVSFFR